MSLRRKGRRFDDLVGRQLDIFAEDGAGLLAEAEDADAAWSRAGREETEELYGDYQLVVDAIGDGLLDLRETYAATLPEDVAAEYRSAFTRRARKRFPGYVSLLEEP